MDFFKLKQVDKIIVKTFLFYFISVLSLTVFISLMSIFYDYMKIIIDKNLGFDVYLRIILNFSLVFFPMCCAIAVIVASVMCFAKLSESLEICAFKSIGISFNRMLQPLFILMLIIGFFVSISSHYLAPKSMKNTIDLLVDLQRLNPAVMIKEGIFNNDLPGVSIFVKEKNADNLMHDVIVYNHSNNYGGYGNNTLLLAKDASLEVAPDGLSMNMHMQDGTNYIDAGATDKEQSVKVSFEKQNIFIDMNRIKNRSDVTDDKMESSLKILEKIERNENIISQQIQSIIKHIEKDYGYLFENKSVKEKNKLKNRIINSIRRNKFNEKIIGEATDIKRHKNYNFGKIRSCNNEIRYYNNVLLRRLVEFLVCIFFLILGAAIGFLLKRGSFIIHLIFAAFFIILYYTVDIVCKMVIFNYYPTPYISSISGLVILLPFIVFFYLSALQDSQILSDFLSTIKYKIFKKK